MVRLPELSSEYINRHDSLMLFETRRFDSRNFMTYLFVDPVRIIKAEGFKDVKRALGDIDRYSRKFYLAGYLAYELGYYFENIKFNRDNYSGLPLIYLVVFDKRFYFNHKTGKTNMDTAGIFSAESPSESFYIRNLKLNITPEEYRCKILKIKEQIKKGNTYQVNFTAKYNFNLLGSAFQLYKELRTRQNVQYGAFCKLKDRLIISLSPELFFRREGPKISSQPMKGTIRRGRDAREERENIVKLRKSLKDRAENLMIVDLVRNDLGRISKVNGVKVSEPFKIRRYETILQMTSQVDGVLKSGVTYAEIFKNIFPGGSVTGAPKIKTMQIIKSLESAPRGVYCGALGFIARGKEAVFNLPIRTIFINGDKGEMGIGSGIVYDSSAAQEFKECRLKASFLAGVCNEFSLIETIGWDNSFKFMKEHLSRMKVSAGYFSFSYNLKDLLQRLRKEEEKFFRGRQYRVRILLDKKGSLKIESVEIHSEAKEKYALLSKFITNPADIFLYHKTTNRAIYEREYMRYKALGYFDVIFMNTRGEITEGAISNVVIEKNSRLYTPVVSSGLLAGVYRGYLLKRGLVKEKVILISDLLNADKVYLCNSVRGILEVKVKGRN